MYQWQDWSFVMKCTGSHVTGRDQYNIVLSVMAVFRLSVTLFVTVIIVTNMNCKLYFIFCTEMTHVHTKSLVDNDMSLCHPLHMTPMEHWIIVIA